MEPAIFPLVLCFILLFPILLLLLRGKGKRKDIDKIPGPPVVPILGTVSVFLNSSREDRLQVSRELTKKYGPIYRLWAGSIPIVNIMKPNDFEVVLGSSKHLDKSTFYNFLHPWLGTGLLTSTGAKWHSHRKMITPTFHFKILENFLEVFNDNANILVDKLKAEVGSGKFNVYPYITACALDIICETAMGTGVNAQSEIASEYVEAIYKLSELIIYRNFRPWLFSDLVFYLTPAGRTTTKCIKILHDFTDKVIKERKQERAKTKQLKEDYDEDSETIVGMKKRVAFLDLLLEASEEGEKLTDQELREEVDTFMFEGHDTTATGMSWILFALGTHPEFQEKVFEELHEIFGDSDRPATMQDLNSLHYLERCIKETMRVYPTVGSVGRTTTEDCKLGNYKIPAGTTISINIYDAHHNPENFPNPEVFDPDNFLPDRIKGRHPYSYVPFSAGPRNCIGQKFAMLEEKTLISAILRKFKVTALDRREDISVVKELIVRPISGINIKIERR